MFQYAPFPATPEEFIGWIADAMGPRHVMVLVHGGRVFQAIHEGFGWSVLGHAVAYFRDRDGGSFELTFDYATGTPLVTRREKYLVVCRCGAECGREVHVTCAHWSLAA